MPISISKRGAVEPFHAMDVLAEANRLRATGKQVVSLAVGQPFDPAPPIVREAAARALATGSIGYTDALGRASLRQAISRHYRDHYGLAVPAERIVVTTGSSAGFNLAFLAMFDAGDRVAITEPGYPAYRNILAALGLEVVEIPLGGHGYLTAELLEAEHRKVPLKGVLFASPANPTGAVIPAEELRKLLAAASDLGVAAISDEIYHRLSYVGEDMSALAFDDSVAVINSFSKYYCMTGWRIGWMVLPEPLVRTVERLQQSLYISAPELSQIAAERAFDASGELDAIKERYRLNRELLLARLPALGLPVAAPMDGAFYAYCDVSQHTNDSMEFARRMIAEAHVAATPGRDFDTREGHRFMRFSYAGSHEDMIAATDALERWLNG
ncbi:aminotransferase class I/II-fold pyridoxal phosphate-dependent enzyme [Aquamicrobium sp. LC103]|uniref:pyridoxal phosphate-dependent aminotransferase n=1 Tax=Aquamicrobium sp. LC103 TaxID=1120658 RepID=UPI00063EC3A0|nr:aminotransferase class I/II-fold pyridoxal phosphate-dependent enzyme [Aquamicrobium sp. LC103]TKT79208.1 aminotransferase class I/II-fold pyridoxal phosphate-dependent enzyme [Aquamicrobium sp. LC103]